MTYPSEWAPWLYGLLFAETCYLAIISTSRHGVSAKPVFRTCSFGLLALYFGLIVLGTSTLFDLVAYRGLLRAVWGAYAVVLGALIVEYWVRLWRRGKPFV
jgi:hypothetical protein